MSRAVRTLRRTARLAERRVARVCHKSPRPYAVAPSSSYPAAATPDSVSRTPSTIAAICCFARCATAISTDKERSI